MTSSPAYFVSDFSFNIEAINNLIPTTDEFFRL